jgi:hypothetical protein
VDRVLPGFVASVPLFVTGLWFQYWRLRLHVDKTTRRQTGAIQEITNRQTGELKGHLSVLKPGRRKPVGRSE